MVAARLKPIYEKEAKERQGERTDLKPDAYIPPNLEECKNKLDNESSSQAAKVLNVSRNSVISADNVIKRADPTVTAAVDSGKLAVLPDKWISSRQGFPKKLASDLHHSKTGERQWNRE